MEESLESLFNVVQLTEEEYSLEGLEPEEESEVSDPSSLDDLVIYEWWLEVE